MKWIKTTALSRKPSHPRFSLFHALMDSAMERERERESSFVYGPEHATHEKGLMHGSDELLGN